MKCETCGLEMMIYKVKQNEDGTRETVFVCRNKHCPNFDQRLKREKASE